MLLHRCILYAQMQGHRMHILNFHAQRKEVVEHWSMEYEGLRFNSLWRLRFFFLCPMIVTRQKTSFSICLPRSKIIFLQF